MTGDRYYLDARPKGTREPWRRVGITKRGRFVWWSSKYGKLLRRTRGLRGSVNQLGVLGFKQWCKANHLDARVDHESSIRARGVDWMIWALDHEPQFHYRQSRPMPLAQMHGRHLPITTDCSGSYTGMCLAAGAPDPNGRNYDGSGYTGTLRARMGRLQHVAACRPMDAIVYGPGTGTHVVAVLEPGDDPLVFSHGQESGPRVYRHSVELRAQGGICTFHTLGVD